MSPLVRTANRLWEIVRANRIVIPYIAVVVTITLLLALWDREW